ncbi:MAG TPA: hypothetical protein DCQ94_02315 [Nitrospira sp.]|nr:hypothetical protein [Nitrospira sp.]
MPRPFHRSSKRRKKSASGVLAALRGSPYGVSTIRLFACCGLAGRPFAHLVGETFDCLLLGKLRGGGHMLPPLTIQGSQEGYHIPLLFCSEL